jgi:phosphatidylethanolamine/phosphatidyl-N-methylethanolamine N-methyltransferase
LAVIRHLSAFVQIDARRATIAPGSTMSRRPTKPREALSFFRAWTLNPRQIGAIAPSGAALADLITREITPASVPVIELGPGTGVFTYALLARGVAQRDLTLVEYGADFVDLLQTRFPQARVLRMDAARLGRHDLFDPATVGAVVSGLPLLNMSSRKIFGIVAGAFDYLRPGGAFYQITYGPCCPVPRRLLDRLGLKATHLGRALPNVPPANVYRITRRRPPPARTGLLPRNDSVASLDVRTVRCGRCDRLDRRQTQAWRSDAIHMAGDGCASC